MKQLICLILATLLASTVFAGDKAAPPIYQSSDSFEDVVDNLKDAVIGKGLNISNVLHASEMLNNTGADLGYPNNVFLHAETLEFCSAMLSHRLVVANPTNMTLCPFTISVYQLARSPETIHITYRPVALSGDAKKIGEDVEQLIRSIIEDAVE